MAAKISDFNDKNNTYFLTLTFDEQVSKNEQLTLIKLKI